MAHPDSHALVRQEMPGRLPTPLMDRNIVLDEIMQMKKDLKVMQIETRRMGDELQHKLSNVDTRLQATESVSRTLDRREQTNADAAEKQFTDLELKLRESMHEISRMKRSSDSGMQVVNSETQKELQQRDGHLQQLDGLARALVSRLKTVEEDMVTVLQKVLTELDKRAASLREEMNKGDHQTVEKLLLLERVLKREAEERARGDVEIRQELSEVLMTVKTAAAQEAAQRASMQRELRSDVDAATKSLHALARSLKEESERTSGAASDRLQQVRAQSEAATSSVQRQLDTFARIFEAERSKQHASVQHALAQMLERTAAVQKIAKEVEGDGQEVKAIALRVQEATTFGVNDLSERLRDALASSRAASAKQERALADLRDSLSGEVQDVRGALAQVETALQSEVRRGEREERQKQEALEARVASCEEAQRQAQRQLWAKCTALEENSSRVAEALRREGDEGRVRMQRAEEELRGELYEQRQRLQAGEAQAERTLHAKLNALHANQGQVVQGLRQEQQSLLDEASRLTATLQDHAVRIEALELRRPPPTKSHASSPPRILAASDLKGLAGMDDRGVEILKPGVEGAAKGHAAKGHEVEGGPAGEMSYLSREFSMPVPRQPEQFDVISFEHLGADASLPATPLPGDDAREREEEREVDRADRKSVV